MAVVGGGGVPLEASQEKSAHASLQKQSQNELADTERVVSPFTAKFRSLLGNGSSDLIRLTRKNEPRQ